MIENSKKNQRKCHNSRPTLLSSQILWIFTLHNPGVPFPRKKTGGQPQLLFQKDCRSFWQKGLLPTYFMYFKILLDGFVRICIQYTLGFDFPLLNPVSDGITDNTWTKSCQTSLTRPLPCQTMESVDGENSYRLVSEFPAAASKQFPSSCPLRNVQLISSHYSLPLKPIIPTSTPPSACSK